MISRHWTGLVKKGREDEYIDHLQNDTFKKLFEIDGFINATILNRDSEEGIEFLIITKWNSLEAIKKFAGENYEIAVVPQIAKKMMIHYDNLAKHYEVKFETK
jgi:heme-degrading monooxygenase HmoA